MTCDLYWRAYELGIEVVTGPSPLARLLGCPAPCQCDVVVHAADKERLAGEPCVWSLPRPGFSHRRIWIAGLPHIAPEDMADILEPEVREAVECVLSRLSRRP